MDFYEEENKTVQKKRVSRVLSRIVTILGTPGAAIRLLCLMCLFYLLGTIIPQGVTPTAYEEAGGGLAPVVTALDLLELFTTPVFLALALVLLASLTVCVIKKYPSLFTKDRCPNEFDPDQTIALTQDYGVAADTVRQVFAHKLGFKAISSKTSYEAVEKGLPSQALSWLQHAALILCFTGFTLTYLFAYEGTMKLSPKKANTLVPHETGRLKSLWTDKDGPTGFHLYLDGFVTEYSEYPDLDYPAAQAARLAIGLGWTLPSYELTSDSLFVTDWKARIRIIKGRDTLYEKTTGVGSPLNYGGYTFYLAGWTDTVLVSVDRNPILLETAPGAELFVPGLTAPLVFGDVKSGRVSRLNGLVEDLIPYTTVRMNSGPGGTKAGMIHIGDSFKKNGHAVAVAGFKQGAVLKYRYDPGAGVVRAAALLFILALSLKTFAGSSTALYEVTQRDGIAYLSFSVSAEGLWYSPEKTTAALIRHLTSDDIRPEELPDDTSA